jgi:hypothetical protein
MKEDPLTPALSPRGEGVRRGLQQRPFSQPYPQADMATLNGKFAKASLRGEGQDEGVS